MTLMTSVQDRADWPTRLKQLAKNLPFVVLATVYQCADWGAYESITRYIPLGFYDGEGPHPFLPFNWEHLVPMLFLLSFASIAIRVSRTLWVVSLLSPIIAILVIQREIPLVPLWYLTPASLVPIAILAIRARQQKVSSRPDNDLARTKL